MNDAYTRAPHQRSTQKGGPSPRAALLIDFDNVTMAIRSNLGQELRKLLDSDIIRGKVSVQRAYADWRRYQQYIVPLSEASIDLIFAPAYGSSKKNATDIRLAIDALELVFTRPEIGTYILLSGDSDFSSLVLKLKEYGKYVIGVGLQESSSDLLVQNCDEYYSYNTLSGLSETTEFETERHDPWELVEKAVRTMVGRDDVMRSDRLKQVMLELDPSFDEKNLGFTKFNRFLAEASTRGLVKLRKMENGQYEVSPVDGGRPKGDDAPRQDGGSARGKEREESPPRVETGSLRDAYDLLRDIVGELTREAGAVRDSEVKREMVKRDGSFDETTLGFRKFSRFLQQAHDEEVVDIVRDDDGNFHVRLPGSRTREERAEPAASRSGGPKEEKEESETTAPEPAAEGSADVSREREPTGRGGDEGPGPERPESDRRARSGGLGRFRTGSRDLGGSSGTKPAVPLPDVDAEGEGEGGGSPTGAARTASSPGESAPDAPPASGGRSGPGSGRPRGGLGRHRRGRRTVGPSMGELPGPIAEESEGGAPAGEESPAEAPAPREETPEPVATVEEETPSAGEVRADPRPAGPPAASSGEIVDHMVSNYAGVGRKTAETLVEEFGDDLLTVIDREPGRLHEILPKHRARAVIEAREAERASG